MVFDPEPGEPSAEATRGDCLSKHDLWNARTFVAKETWMLDDDPLVSIEKWVDLNSDCVLYYQRQELSELVKNPQTTLMDTTFGVNRYGFELATMSLINEFANGFHFAHAIVQHTNATELSKFLRAVQSRVVPWLGRPWRPTFIIDMNVAEVNAIKAVFGEDYAKTWIIYCTWHVTRAWVKNAWEKMPSNSTQRFDRSNCLTKLLDVLYTVTEKGERAVPSQKITAWVSKWTPVFPV
eukprot:gene3443-4326_t